jgi:hypothetical protein
VNLKGRKAPLYVVQGRNPDSLSFIPSPESLPVTVIEGR